jgi:starch synthase (maltosyl-transferring)
VSSSLAWPRRLTAGRFPIKRIVGDLTIVEADILADGHDAIAAALLYRREGETEWSETPMEFLGNDRWRGSFSVEELGRYLLYHRGLG